MKIIQNYTFIIIIKIKRGQKIFQNIIFLKPKEIIKFKENLSDSSYMFYKCLNLKNIDLTFFDTTNIINMSHMFADNNL